MFKFRKLFSLEHDVLPRIPQEQISDFKSGTSSPVQSLPVDFVQHNYISSSFQNTSVMNNSLSNLTSTSATNSSIGIATNHNNNNNSHSNITSTPPKVLTFSDIKQYKLGSSYGSVIRISNNSSNIISTNSPNNNNNGSKENLPQSLSSLNLNNNNSNSSSNNNSIMDGDVNDTNSISENSEDFVDLLEDQNNNYYHQHQNQQLLNSVIQQSYCGSINLRIIGRERNGNLLIARTSKLDGTFQTFIDIFDLNTKQFQNILSYHGVITNATLSNDSGKSFLVFTVKLPEKMLDGKQMAAKELYSSFIYEVVKKNNTFIQLETNVPHPLVYQFIAGLHDKSSMSLLMYQADEIWSVKIALNKSEDQLVFKKPNLPNINKYQLLKKCYWSQYDHNHQILYSLQMKSRSIVNYSSTSNGIGQCESILKLHSVQGGKFTQLDDSINLSLTNIDSTKLSTNIPMPLGAYKFQSSYYDSPQVSQNIHVVKLPAKGYCLCHQEETTKQHIKISIYMLHLKQKIRYSIPINSLDEEIQNSNIRILFDSFGSLLMVYIPGYFFQFIDCSAIDHEPCFNITLHRKDLSNLVQQDPNSYDSSDLLSLRTTAYPKKISTNVIPFYFQTLRGSSSLVSSPLSQSSTNLLSQINILSNIISTNNNGISNKSTSSLLQSQFINQTTPGLKIVQYLYDCHHGMIYQYQVERESIIKLFENGMEPGIDILSMHLAISHFDDEELGDSIISHAAKSNLITTELFKEYILANTYRLFKQFSVDPVYLQLLPMTSSDSFESTIPTKILKDIEISMISSSLYPKKEDFKKRFKSFEAKKSEIQNREGPTFTGFIKNLMGLDDNPVDLQNSLRRSLGPSDIMSLNIIKSMHRLGIDMALVDPAYEEDPFKDISSYIQSLTEIWSQLSQKDSKEKLNDCAVIYRTLQILVVNNLYRSIKICYASGNSNRSPVGIMGQNNNSTISQDLTNIRDMKHPSRLVYFHALEKLYSSIEELYCPFPKDFYAQFASLGFYCLSRHIFLQFLQKGIIVITNSFVQLLRKEFPDTQRLSTDDRNFINQIILQLKDNDQIIEELQLNPSNMNLIHEHYISNATQNISPKPVDLVTFDPDYIKSYFIPLSTLLDFLKSLANAPNHFSSPSSMGASNSSNSSFSPPPSSPISSPIHNSVNPKYFTPPQSPIRQSIPPMSPLQTSQPISTLAQAYIIKAYHFVEQNQNSVLNNIRKPGSFI